MFEFILLFIFFWWLFSRNEKRKERKRKLFKPSLDQELKELIQSEDNSTGIALSVKQYLLDVLDDDKNDREKYSDARLTQGQEILDKAGASALYFMADIATQLSIVASAQINGIPNNVEAISLKSVHRKAQTFLITNNEIEARQNQKRVDQGVFIGIQKVLIPQSSALDELVSYLKTFTPILAGEVPIISLPSTGRIVN
jgi:hypothetical protein